MHQLGILAGYLPATVAPRAAEASPRRDSRTELADLERQRPKNVFSWLFDREVSDRLDACRSQQRQLGTNTPPTPRMGQDARRVGATPGVLLRSPSPFPLVRPRAPSCRPVRHRETRHAFEFPPIRRDERRAASARLRRDQHIVGANRRAGAFQIGADVSGMSGIVGIEG